MANAKRVYAVVGELVGEDDKHLGMLVAEMILTQRKLEFEERKDLSDEEFRKFLIEHGSETLDFVEGALRVRMSELPKVEINSRGYYRCRKRGVQQFIWDANGVLYYINDSGDFCTVTIKVEEAMRKVLNAPYRFVEGFPRTGKFIKALREREKQSSAKVGERGRSRLTGSDCSLKEQRAVDGKLELVVSGFSESRNGVCKVDSAVTMVDVHWGDIVYGNVRVLDLSACTGLHEVTVQANVTGRDSKVTESFALVLPKVETGVSVSLAANTKRADFRLAESARFKSLELSNCEVLGLDGERSIGYGSFLHCTGLKSLRLKSVAGSNGVYLNDCDTEEVALKGWSGVKTIRNCRKLKSVVLMFESIDIQDLLSIIKDCRSLERVSLHIGYLIGEGEFYNRYKDALAILNFGSSKLRSVRIDIRDGINIPSSICVMYDSKVEFSSNSKELESHFKAVNLSTEMRDFANLLAYFPLRVIDDKLTCCIEVKRGDWIRLQEAEGNRVYSRETLILPDKIERVIGLSEFYGVRDSGVALKKLVVSHPVEISKTVCESIGEIEGKENLRIVG
jgi:hypothetical protein|nr:MAG TPA: hypothetical protein [Caudoviricetes sp.]